MSISSTTLARDAPPPEDQPPIRNESIMASAGSGKTFALSSRYLQLVLMGAEPGSILASTFTRLAAGEIRDRILERLAEAATDDDKRRELAGAVHNQNLKTNDVLDALIRLTRRMHQLQVRTLDSFFTSIVKCFALELGIDPSAAVIDTDLDMDLRREAIEMMLDERDPQPLIDLLRVLSDGNDARSVTETIDAEMRQLYELYREAPPEAWESISFWRMLDEDELQDAIEKLIASPPHEDGRFINAHAKDRARAQTARPHNVDDWFGFLDGGLAKAIEFGGKLYYKKPVEQHLLLAYEPLIEHAKAVVRNSIVSRTHSTRDLLKRFHVQYEQAKARHKAMTFADITAKMAHALDQPTADEICFRLDATLRHILLDEMQDTSHQQWEALQEIVRSIISDPPPDRSFFCVGDVKQSIYGWREACPEILAQMPRLIEALGGDPNDMSAGKPLVTNWRSSPFVLDTVDRVLICTSDNPAMNGCAGAARAWDAAYLPHEAHHKDMPGYVELRTAPRAAEDDGNQQVVRLQHAADLIAQLSAQTPHCTIGVLTRTNKTVNRLLYELGPAGRNLDVAGRGGGSLTDSAAVNAALDLLRVADHPENTIAAFNVIHSPLGEALQFIDCKQRHSISRAVRQQLLDHGYARTIGHWIALIGGRTDLRQLRRLIKLQQLAAQFDQRPRTLRTDDFIEMVSVTPAADPGAARVQVMTVHQSKGLEFDIVVLADLDQHIVRTNGIHIVVERDALGNIQRVARHGRKEMWALFDDLQPMFDQQLSRMARESLCLLYVAMTRAKRALYMVIDPPRENEKSVPKTLAGIVRSALASNAKQIEPQQVIYQHGDAQWFDSLESAASTAPSSDDASQTGRSIRLTPARGDVPRGRTGLAVSQHETIPTPAQSSTWTMRLPDHAARDRGTAIHAMFESVQWIEDFAPERERLVKIALQVAPRRGNEWAGEQVDAFLTMLEQPVIRAALTRPTASGSVRLWCERSFARLEDGVIRSGQIDRLVAEYDPSGRCIHATIIDFKTDLLGEGGTAARAEHYRPQLEAYRSAAAEMLSISPSHIAMKLLFVALGEVIELQVNES